MGAELSARCHFRHAIGTRGVIGPGEDSRDVGMCAGVENLLTIGRYDTLVGHTHRRNVLVDSDD